ncbi:MAG: ABC transporter substrate-binding protein [Candidatus Sericytochromatia bacterium]
MKKLLLGFLSISFLSAGLSYSSVAKAEEKELVIGAILPLTGKASEMGQEMKKGALLAKDYWKKEKKSNINIIIEDSKSLPKDGVSAYMKLKSNNVNLFTTTLSSVCLALLPKVDEDNILLFADAAHPKITEKFNPRVFRNSSTSESEAKEIFKSLVNKNSKIIDIIYLNSDYGVSFLNHIKNISGSKIKINEISFNEDTINYKNLALKINKNSDSVVIVGIGKSIGNLIKSIKLQGFSGNIYANIGYILTGGRESAGNLRKGVLYTQMKVNPLGISEWANKQYKKMYNKKITADALLEFNSISLIKLASQKTNLEPNQISKNMTKSVKELFGTNKLNSKGDILADVEVVKEVN